jgi:hypothetical protein
MTPDNANSLRDACSGLLIVTYKEDTAQLRAALEAEGLPAQEVKGPYTAQQLGYSAVMQALVNHANAWRIAAGRSKPTIVMEPDFVPVLGFGGLPVPIPSGKQDKALAYVYCVGPEIWDLSTPSIARAHCGGAVALLIPPPVAQLLLEFFEEEVIANASGQYRPWDSGMGYWLLARGVESYMPYRHYGEHGGLGNPEHARFGLGRNHRADALLGKLAFLPVYAQGSRARFWLDRLRGRAWGLLRLLSGRLLRRHDLARARGARLALLRFAAGRLLVGSRAAQRGRDFR